MARLAYQALRDGVRTGTVVARQGKPLSHEGLLQGYPARLPSRDLYDQINGDER